MKTPSTDNVLEMFGCVEENNKLVAKEGVTVKDFFWPGWFFPGRALSMAKGYWEGGNSVRAADSPKERMDGAWCLLKNRCSVKYLLNK